MSIYGTILSDNNDIVSVFKNHELLAIKKGLKFTCAITQIGESLSKGECPSFKHISLASEYYKK